MSDDTSVIKKALKRITELQMEVDKLRADKIDHDPIVLVGIGCRFPGGANSVEQFWELLKRGDNAIVDIPKERWSAQEFYSDGIRTTGKTYAKKGGLIKDIDCFDNTLFGISSQEAEQMDPQQRILLETSWHAIEDAMIAPQELRGKPVGTFLAMGEVDYSRWSYHSGNPEKIGSFTKLGVSRAIGVGRINYTFDFRGPAVLLDTTCSSSLLAIHLATKSLQSGECDLALAGGVNLMLTPEDYIGFSALSALSPNDICKPFDTDANGYVRGEGCGIVVLKRLSDALRDKDRIYCVLRGSACNHDGQSNGLTAPNGVAQEKVIQQALKNSGLTTNDIGYIEAHGTGTKLGDPIEVAALTRALNRDATDAPLLAIGSVKGQIGHLESAAGVASFIKAALIQYYSCLPGNKNINAINPLIRLDKTSIKIPVEHTEWQEKAIGVSAFGMSGTNVHIVIDSAKKVVPENTKSTFNTARLPERLALIISACSYDSLMNLISAHIKQIPLLVETDVVDYCVINNNCREFFAYKVEINASNSYELIDKLIKTHSEYRLLEHDSTSLEKLLNNKTSHNMAINKIVAHKKIKLPLYPFSKKRFWIDNNWAPYTKNQTSVNNPIVFTHNVSDKNITDRQHGFISSTEGFSISSKTSIEIAENLPKATEASNADENALSIKSEVLSLLWRIVDKKQWTDDETTKSLSEFGLCSIAALECNQQIFKKFHVDIPSINILEHSVEKITEQILTKMSSSISSKHHSTSNHQLEKTAAG